MSTTDTGAATEAAKATGTAGETYDTESFTNKLWRDLKSDSERSAWLLLGRGYETGVIAASLQNELAMAYHRLSLLAEAARQPAPALHGEPDAFMVVQGGDEPVSVHFLRVNAKISAKKFGASEIVPLYRAALASPADALVAGDSETARLEFVFANGLPMKRGGEYRCHGYPGEWFKTEREAIDAAIQAQKDGA